MCELPHSSLLRRYLAEGAYTDCYVTDLPGRVSFEHYVEAFYTTWLFKLERVLLSWFVRRPSTDIEAGELACGKISSFAAWDVEERAADQLLLSDFQGRTRSWLMCAPAVNDRRTRLFFGSAVVPMVDKQTGEKRIGTAFYALQGFHKLYAQALLRAAAKSCPFAE
jgi:hypothetical protein